MSKILIVGVLAESLINFRGELIKTLIRNGNDVYVMAGESYDNQRVSIVRDIERIGAKYIDYPIKRNSLNPIGDIVTCLSIRKTLKMLCPDIVLAYTIKPIIWCGLAIKTLRQETRYYALVTGLGYSFQLGGLKRKILSYLVIYLLKNALCVAEKVIFQNNDNLTVFIHKGIVNKENTEVVSGSGVNINKYSVAPFSGQGIVFLCIARLLVEKGLREYIEAIRIVKEQYADSIFMLVGPQDLSLDKIPFNEVLMWDKLGLVKYCGGTNDVRPYIEACHVYVLPSYHEGMPRTVLEAMAMGRPIITTNTSGCRDTVIEGINGFLVPVKDSKELAEKMIWFIRNKHQIENMGRKSRLLVEKKFDVNIVNMAMMKIMNLSNTF